MTGPAASVGSLAWGAALALVACSSSSKREQPAATTVHTLRLPVESVTLPDQPGRATVESACAVCHTLRYVLDQPPFSRAQWEAEVSKMHETYGAPVSDADAPVIVGYLVAVRGDGS